MSATVVNTAQLFLQAQEAQRTGNGFVPVDAAVLKAFVELYHHEQAINRELRGIIVKAMRTPVQSEFDLTPRS
jgi:hypothetical protein